MAGGLVAGRKACLNVAMRMLPIFLLLPGMPLLASAAEPGEAGLPPCPSSPNCVSSGDPVPARRVEAIREAFGNIMEAQKGGGPGNR
jgi:hypothetical protein